MRAQKIYPNNGGEGCQPPTPPPLVQRDKVDGICEKQSV